MNEIKELIPFNNACEELIAGKYILADIKIASILKIVETNEKIKNIVATCLEDFNFKTSFSAAIKQTNENFSFVLPEQEKNLVALVYSLLCNINNGTLNFTDFLKSKAKRGNDDRIKKINFGRNLWFSTLKLKDK